MIGGLRVGEGLLSSSDRKALSGAQFKLERVTDVGGDVLIDDHLFFLCVKSTLDGIDPTSSETGFATSYIGSSSSRRR